MKSLSTAVLSVCVTLSSLCSLAQTQKIPLNEPDYNKPKLFNDLPDRIDINPSSLQNLFLLQTGQTVTVPFTSNFSFTGQVVSTSNSSNSVSVVIKSTNRVGANLTFTKVFDTDYTVRYVGRIISIQHGDVYDLSFDNNQYYFKKKGFYDLLNE
jgi:hypothetical protein